MQDLYITYSEILFARPSALEGIARMVDLGATFSEYNRSKTPEQADARAVSADWRATGRDIAEAIVTESGKLAHGRKA